MSRFLERLTFDGYFFPSIIAIVLASGNRGITAVIIYISTSIFFFLVTKFIYSILVWRHYVKRNEAALKISGMKPGRSMNYVRFMLDGSLTWNIYSNKYDCRNDETTKTTTPTY